jgi:protein-disulfide isomerase
MSLLRVAVTPDDHIQGSFTAPVIMVEYGDYECPFCGLAHPIVKRLQKRFGREMSLVFRHFPLATAHPHAESAAETAEFAGAHDLFWEMHDGLFENQASLGLPLYFALAKSLDLPTDKLRTALATGLFAPTVRSNFIGGARSGVNGTPSFFINGRRYDGSFEFQDMVMAIDLALLDAKASLSPDLRSAR